MGSRENPLAKLREAIEASRSEIRNGLASFEAARGLMEDKDVIACVSATRFAGHAANAIVRACMLDALMSAARLWDGRDSEDSRDRPCNRIGRKSRANQVCRHILFQLQGGSVQKAIERRAVSRGHSAKLAGQRVHRLIQRVTMLESAADPAYQKLKEIRDSWLAHRDRNKSFARDGTATFPSAEFERLLRIAAAIANGVELLADGHSQKPSFRWDQASRRRDGAELWNLLVSGTTGEPDPSMRVH